MPKRESDSPFDKIFPPEVTGEPALHQVRGRAFRGRVIITVAAVATAIAAGVASENMGMIDMEKMQESVGHLSVAAGEFVLDALIGPYGLDLKQIEPLFSGTSSL